MATRVQGYISTKLEVSMAFGFLISSKS